jgi:hypothetical protein
MGISENRDTLVQLTLLGTLIDFCKVASTIISWTVISCFSVAETGLGYGADDRLDCGSF